MRIGTEVRVNPCSLPLDLVPDQFLAREAVDRIHAGMRMVERDCRDVVELIGKIGSRWTVISDDWDQFLETVTGKPAPYVRKIIDGVDALQASGYKGPISASEAVARARVEAQTVKAGGANNPHGRNQHSPKEVNGCATSIDQKPREHCSNSGLLRRLAKKGETELLEAVETGSISVHAAAIKAGLKRPVSRIPNNDPIRAAQAIRKLFKGEELRVLIDALQELQAVINRKFQEPV